MKKPTSSNPPHLGHTRGRRKLVASSLGPVLAAAGVRLAPHCAYFGPGYAAVLQCQAAFAPQEPFERLYVELEADICEGLRDVRQGLVQVPDRAGLGCAPNLNVLKQYKVASS
jgi:L-alanine-DL-glutamate epimerase-like enolase superfamily enzyme